MRTRPWHSAIAKMLLGTTLVVVPALLGVFELTVHKQTELEMEQVDRDVRRVADVLRHELLIADDDAQGHGADIERALGDLASIQNVRLIRSDGSIVYSRTRGEVGTRPDTATFPACAPCHGSAGVIPDSIASDGDDRPSTYHRTFALDAEGDCATCHTATEGELGQMVVSIDIDDVQDELRSYRRAATWAVAATMLALITGVALLFDRIVRRPLHALQQQMRRVEHEDFEIAPMPGRRDEVGQLHNSFAQMAHRLGAQQTALRDRVTERTERASVLSRRLREIDADLVRLDRLSAVGALSAKVVHEVRTPLNALSLNLQLLQRELDAHDAVPQSVVELARNTRAEVQRINTVLTRFMERARMPRARVTTEQLDDMVRGVLTLFASEAAEEGVALEMAVEAGLPSIRLPGDALRQMLTNLVSNAIRACEPGGTVLVKAHRCNEEILEVTVEDDGCGIPEEVRGRIFEPFFTTSHGGTGLGLAIVRQVAEQLGGAVSVEHVAPTGTRFVVRVPVERPEREVDHA